MPDPTKTLRETREPDQCITCRHRANVRVRGDTHEAQVKCKHLPNADWHPANMVCDLWEAWPEDADPDVTQNVQG